MPVTGTKGAVGGRGDQERRAVGKRKRSAFGTINM